MAGFYPVDHGIMDHPVFGISKRPSTKWEAYCWLLDHAAFDQSKTNFRGAEVTLARGEIPISLGFLAGTWRWHRSAVKRFLDGLVAAEFIEYPTHGTIDGTAIDTAVTIVSLCKYSYISTTSKGLCADSGTANGTVVGGSPYIDPLNKRNKKTTKDSDRQPDMLGYGLVVPMPVDDVQIAYEGYRVTARALGLSVPQMLTTERRRLLRQRLTDVGGLDGWKAALEKVARSDWITSGRWKNFSIDDMTNRGKFCRLMEGRYETVFDQSQSEETPWTRDVREYQESDGEHSLFRQPATKGDGT